MNRTSWLALAAVLGALSPAFTYAQSPRFEVQLKGSEELGIAGGLFVPFVMENGTVLFADGWLNYSGDERLAGSLGAGVRHDMGSWIAGANAYLDFSRSENGFTYQQLAAGIEALSEHWEFRLNGYAPFGDSANAVDSRSSLNVVDGRFIYNQGYEVALYGVDAEIGVRLPVFDADSASALKLYAGGYVRGSEHTEMLSGLTLRSELTLALDQQYVPGATFSLGGGVRLDSTEQVSASAYIRFSAPIGGATTAHEAASPLFQRVERDRAITTRTGAYGADQVARSAAGSEHVVQISGNDPASALNAMVSQGGEGAIILADGEISVDDTLLLLSRQTLVGGGGVVNLFLDGGRQLQYHNPGAATVLKGQLASPLAPDVLSLADGSRVSTLAIIGGHNAISASGVRDIRIENVSVSSTARHGVALDTVSDVFIGNVTITDTDSCGTGNECKYKQGSSPDEVMQAAISAVGVRGLSIHDTTITNSSHGVLVASDVETVNWMTEMISPASGIDMRNVKIVNTNMEAMMFVGVDDIAVDNLHIDNTAMDRTLDLIVVQNTAGLALSNATLKGGVNALMMSYIPGFPADNPQNISLDNVAISDTSRAGIFFNPSWDVTLRDVSISNAGTYGLHIQGDSYGFMGGAVRDIDVGNLSITDATDGGIYLYGPLNDAVGDIVYSGQAAPCVFDSSPWSGTEFVQGPGKTLLINGQAAQAMC